MRVLRTVEDMREARDGMGKVVFVPTMGALHEGHLSLMDRAKEIGGTVLVSIFVNPTQFGEGEDFEEYPRPEERDLELCEARGVDVVFMPRVEEMYPEEEVEVVVDVPGMSRELEGAERPGHFVGVCLIVAKLFGMVKPDVACFGQKDYQQLKIVEAMAKGLGMGIRIEMCPTVREADGLAMSSRNVYLSEEERRKAVGLVRALEEARGMIEGGEGNRERVENVMMEVIEGSGMVPDYAVVRDAKDLGEVELPLDAGETMVCLVAGRLGRTRLLDNMVAGV